MEDDEEFVLDIIDNTLEIIHDRLSFIRNSSKANRRIIDADVEPCCDNRQRAFLVSLINEYKRTHMGESYKDIGPAVVYYYYATTLAEPHHGLIELRHISRNPVVHNIVEELVHGQGASDIRRRAMGLRPHDTWVEPQRTEDEHSARFRELVRRTHTKVARKTRPINYAARGGKRKTKRARRF